MRNVTSAVVMLAVITALAGWTTTGLGQEYKKGDTVVALRYADLKVGRKAVGKVQKGEKVTVEQVQDKWLWVHSGETRGWIDSRSVISSALLAWYQRLPDNTSVKKAAETRARFNVVLFCIHRAGSGPAQMIGGDGGIYGVPMGPFVDAAYSNVRIIVEKRGNRHRSLWIKFDPPGGATQIVPPPRGWTKGDPYGLVLPGDYVLIDQSRKVYVNGELRRTR